MDIKQVHWKEIHGKLRGDAYAVRANPQMLIEGYSQLRKVSIGSKLGGWEEITIEVSYDRDYVVLWLVEKVIKPFSKVKFQTLQKLIGDAYRVYKEQE